jgi:glycosyltransferase involved in cell wall biosynthesis
MLRVLALLPYPTGRVPGQRYRIEQWARLLRSEAIELSFHSFLTPHALQFLYQPGHTASKIRATLGGLFRRLMLDLCDHQDLIFVYREVALMAPAWLETRFLRGKPFVYDFDDAIYLRDVSPANAWTRVFKSAQKTARLCHLARHVTVGNDVLASFAIPRAHAVTVIPSTIDTDLYQLIERPPNPRPVVGWTGSATTVPYLEPLRDVLTRVRAVLDYEFRVIGGRLSLPGLQVVNLPWRAESEVEDLSALDVGLMPLHDDAWSRGKCSMKALQYMALGIPPVVTPVGANAVVVRDGVNGFHARNDDEWVDRIVTLLRDPTLRARMGAAARQTVEERYSARVQAPRMARVLREAVG